MSWSGCSRVAAMLRLLLILVDAAKESVAESASRTTVQLHSDESSARVRQS